MLNESEVKRVKKYAVLSVLISSSMHAAFAATLVWGIFFAVASFASQIDTNFGWWIAIVVLILVAFTAVFIYVVVSCKKGFKSKEWSEICQKADGVTPEDGSSLAGIGTLAAVAPAGSVLKVSAATRAAGAVSAAYRSNAALVAEKCGVSIPSVKSVAVKSIIIAAAATMLLCFIGVAGSCSGMNDTKAVLGENVQKVFDAFDNAGMDNLHSDWIDRTTGKIDPGKIPYRTTGYSMTFLDEPVTSSSARSYVELTMTKDGVITSVRYTYRVDAALSAEENYQNMKKSFTAYHDTMLKAGVSFKFTELKDVYLPADEYKDRFLSFDFASGADGFNINQGMKVTDHLTKSGDYIASIWIR